MKNSKLKIDLIGKKYMDEILKIKEFNKKETNHILKIENQIGGIKNFSKCNSKKIQYNYHFIGVKKAYVLVEQEKSIRSSFTKDIEIVKKYNFNSVNDWLHIAYIDDICENLEIDAKNLSIDFCTTKQRNKYLKYIKKSTIIFDSRERKNLYKNIDIDNHLILHDEKGCECINKNKVIYRLKGNTIDNLNVNGAGDIFAGFFIEKLLQSNIKDALEYASNKTTQTLISVNNEKI